MENDELPVTKVERVDWVIRAENNQEMRRRYDLWAQLYDSDVGSYDDYLVPREAAKVALRTLSDDARIFDAGAGTGLVGQALSAEGFKNLVAVDYSAQMLEVARSKGVLARSTNVIWVKLHHLSHRLLMRLLPVALHLKCHHLASENLSD